MIVAEYNFGKTKVLIDNSYVCKTPEEQERIDREIVLDGWSIIDELI